MAYKTGKVQFLHNSTSVGGARSTTGLVTGGRFVEQSEVRDERSIGNWRPEQLRAGLVTGQGTADFYVQQDGDILQLVERNGGTGRLTEFDIECGNNSEARIHSNCKIDSLSLECNAGTELMCRMAWKGLSASDGSADTMTQDSDDVLMWYEGAFSGIASLEIVGFTFTVNHNVDWQPVIDSTLSPRRKAKYIVEKDQQVQLQLKTLQVESHNYMADEMPLISSIVFTFTGITSTNVVKLTITDLQRETKERPITPSDTLVYTHTYIGKDFTITDS